MKKTQKLTAMVLSIILAVSMMATQAFAAGNKTEQINGYPIEELSPAKPQLEINNIISTLTIDKGMKITDKTDTGDELWATAEDIDYACNAAAPVTIKTLDTGYIFIVWKLQQDGNFFRLNDDNIMPYTSGKIEVEDADGKSKTIDINATFSEDDYLKSFLPGCTVTLKEAGTYYAEFQYPDHSGATRVFINVGGNPNDNPTTPKAVTATPTASKIMVDGNPVSFDAYNINGSNYIKLRDFAKAVSGSPRQFDVSFSSEKNAILLASLTPYTTVGGELAAGDGKVKSALPCASKIIQDGTEIALTAYNIGGNNYFKLRDLASAFYIGVTYDSAAGTIGVNTSGN